MMNFDPFTCLWVNLNDVYYLFSLYSNPLYEEAWKHMMVSCYDFQ
ncbi:hypothetical protein HanRHA438_Chr05g0212531 [Helianthus annuus]|nr:hypothetical protein HanRHA438_Chr05g0212531 [Helianthus annuus]